MSEPFPDQYSSFLHDESRLSGQAEEIAFPASEKEAAELIGRWARLPGGVTIQGSRTGICGGAVPPGGRLLNLSEMNRPLSLSRAADGAFLLQVQPGYSLATLRRDLARGRFDWLDPAAVDPGALAAFGRAGEQFWPPDPSEVTASLGGLASTNARGPGAFRYGPAGDHIQAVRLMRPDGRVYDLARGLKFQGRAVAPPWGGRLELNPADLGLAEEADLLDLILGGEGQAGPLLAVTLRLAPKPAEMWAITMFFNSEEGAAGFIDAIRSAPPSALTALDFLDAACLAAAGDLKKVAAKLRELPDPPEGAAAAVWLELHAADAAEMEDAAGRLLAAAEEHGSDSDSSWALSGDEIEKMRLFRHAVPESINTKLDQIRLAYPEATKLAADMTWPGLSFADSLRARQRDMRAAGAPGFIFGHAADNHLHVNFLPQDQAQHDRAREVLIGWLEEAARLGGRLFREHGVGRLKKGQLDAAENPARLAARRRWPELIDPAGLWNPGLKGPKCASR